MYMYTYDSIHIHVYIHAFIHTLIYIFIYTRGALYTHAGTRCCAQVAAHTSALMHLMHDPMHPTTILRASPTDVPFGSWHLTSEKMSVRSL